ncbi:ABC transporter permease [Inquilinus sp. YAF38]|uniref:ABC transporter permease n=1 Tax=Inquilinus sp. YAF38 TaxID=3233084 RepID=UPI003F931156
MGRMLSRLYMGLIGAVLLAPIIVIIGVSLNEKKRLLFPPQGLSFAWYGEMLQDPEWVGALSNSVVIAVLAAALSVSIALPMAWYLWRWNPRWGRALYTLGIAPFILPPVVSALGFLIFWQIVGLYGHIAATIISHGIFFVTLPLVNIALGLGSIDKAAVEAARTLGADERTVFRTIVLPLARPYIISGYAFAFVLSLNEYIVAYMVAGSTVETLPIKIFNALRYGYTPVMASVTVLFVVVAAVVFSLVAWRGDLPRLLGATRPPR